MTTPSLDRRTLLKGVAAATAAIAVPRVFDAAAAAAPGHTRSDEPRGD